MAKRDRLEEDMARLARLGGGEKSDDALDQLRAGLASRSYLLAEKAAISARSLEARELAAELAAAYNRFFDAEDKGAIAKKACIEALNRLEAADERRLLRGARHVQMEAVFGGSVDVAGPLRAECLAGLVASGYARAHEEAVRLLVDKLPEVRLAAVQALGALAGRESALLLRYKAMVGDEEPGIVGECFSALMRLAPEDSLEFVRERMMAAPPPVALGAALALGESARPEAFELLRAVRATRNDDDIRRGTLLPISLLRSDDAFGYLMGVLREEKPPFAAEAVKVLRIYAEDPERRAAIEAAARDRNDAYVWRVFDIKYANPS